MRSLFLSSFLLCVSCALVDQIQQPRTKHAFKELSSYPEYVKELGEPDKCVSYLDTKSCRWESDMVSFQNDSYVDHSQVDSENEFVINVQAFSDGSNVRKVFLRPGLENINPDGLEWKQVEKNFRAVMLLNDYEIVNNIQDSDAVVLISFGISEKFSTFSFQVTHAFGPDVKSSNKVTSNRILVLNAVKTPEYLKDRKKVEIWKVNVSSVGVINDILRVIPALSLSTMDYIGKSSDSVQTFSIYENSLELKAFKNHTKKL